MYHSQHQNRCQVSVFFIQKRNSDRAALCPHCGTTTLNDMIPLKTETKNSDFLLVSSLPQPSLPLSLHSHFSFSPFSVSSVHVAVHAKHIRVASWWERKKWNQRTHTHTHKLKSASQHKNIAISEYSALYSARCTNPWVQRSRPPITPRNTHALSLSRFLPLSRYKYVSEERLAANNTATIPLSLSLIYNIHARVHVCICVCMCVCVYVSMYLCM
jgi:hypothetical protein